MGLSQAISDPNCVSLTTGTTFVVCLFKSAEYLVTFFFRHMKVFSQLFNFRPFAVLGFQRHTGKGLAKESLE